MKKLKRILGIGVLILGIAFTFNTETAFASESAPPECKRMCMSSSMRCKITYDDYEIECHNRIMFAVIEDAN